MIKIYIDENLSHHIAHGLDKFENSSNGEYKVLSIKEIFGKGAKDEEWIPKVGEEGGVVVTQDLNINRSRAQQRLFREHGVGIFFFAPPSRTGFGYWEMVEQVVRRWQEIRKRSKNSKPFAYRCTSKSKGFEDI